MNKITYQPLSQYRIYTEIPKGTKIVLVGNPNGKSVFKPLPVFM